MYVSHEDPTSSPIYSAHRLPGLVDQFIDHNDPPLGTFKQRYWLNANYYKTGAELTASWGMSTEREMGADLIVVFTPGEVNICDQW